MSRWFVSVSAAALCVGAVGSASATWASSPSTVTEVIVTGTRATGVKAGDSSNPILVVGGDALKDVGQPNLNDALALSVPAFITESLGADLGNVVTTASLRGLSPNDTLVMIDGKRRHTTGMLHVDPSAFQGAFAPDLSLIPPAAIDHVEVETNGASAQYGSDAIAGVMNFILKKADRGGSITADAGQYYKGDGKSADVALNFGLPLGQNGFVNITAEERYHGFSQRGGPDVRLYAENGTPLPGTPPGLPNAPDVNHIDGDGMSQTSMLFVNAGYRFNDSVEAYAIGTYAHRNAWGHENYRTPCKIVASSTLGVPGSCPPGPGDIQPFPLGFNPFEFVREDDYAITGGLRGKAAGWNWDLSTTWGQDYDPQWTLDSANASLFIDTHFTPRDFYDGFFRATEWTTNLDINRDFDVGMAGPMNVAFGGEARTDRYQIGQGDPGSIYKEGGQSFPGYQPTDAGTHTRTNYSGYLDFALNPVTGWKVDLAGRAEHYSDFGDTTVGQLVTRYDFNPRFAIRGTVSTGFRAPTLAEEFYSATNVSPTFAVITLPADTAAAHDLGFTNLKPEKSTNYSIGFVSEPIDGFHLTADAYQIDITNRIVATGTILGESGGSVVNANVLAAIAAHGNILDPGVQFVGVTVFTNGVNTRTQGAELTANWTNSGDWGRIDWTLVGNYNKTTITKFAAPPPAIASSTPSLLSPESISNLTVTPPIAKIILNARYSQNKWWVNARETLYGEAKQWVSPDGTGSGPGAYEENVPWTFITNLEVGYHITDHINAAVGANNLFNKTPPTVRFCGGITCDGQQEALVWDAPVLISPYGINGGFYYGRLQFTW